MWKYNQTDELYHNAWEYNNPDELYHHGILGMRWHHRKAQLKKWNKDRIEGYRERNIDRIKWKSKKYNTGSPKYNKLMQKLERTKKSRYGATNARLIGSFFGRNIVRGLLSSTASSSLKEAGFKKAAKAIDVADSVITTGDAINTARKVFNNYKSNPKKRKK